MTLSGLDIVAPDPEDAPGQTVHIAVSSIDVRNEYAGASIKQGDAKVAGVVIEPSPGSDAGKSLASLGYTKIELAMTVGAKYQAEAKTFALENFTVDGVQMGSVGLKANFTDVAPQLVRNRQRRPDASAVRRRRRVARDQTRQRRHVREGARLLRQAAGRLARQAARAMVGDGRTDGAGDARGQPGRARARRRSAEVRRRAEDFDDQRQGQERRAESERLHGGSATPAEIVGKLDISAAANR